MSLPRSRRYAGKTKVPVDQSRKEIERVLEKYGATGFGYGWDRRQVKRGPDNFGTEEHIVITFDMRKLRIQLDAAMPKDPAAQRQRWRALLLVIKAKLEAVESGLGTLESEFLSNVVTKDGRTIGQIMLPRLTEVVERGLLLPAARTP